jgi:hypothetical protein
VVIPSFASCDAYQYISPKAHGTVRNFVSCVICDRTLSPQMGISSRLGSGCCRVKSRRSDLLALAAY